MRKRSLAVLLIICILLLSCPVFAAVDAVTDNQSLYEQGKYYIKLRQYGSALHELSKIPKYLDSRDWIDYCIGKLRIENATYFEEKGYISEARDQILESQDIFGLLSGMEDSDSLYEYCIARDLELQGLWDSAEEKFLELRGVEDSRQRYLRISKKEPLPTDAPAKVKEGLLKTYSAKALKNIKVWLGPGTKYAAQSIIKIKAGTSVSAIAQEGSFVMLEKSDGESKVRFWAQMKYVSINGNKAIPKLKIRERTAYVLAESTALRGPGKKYHKSPTVLMPGDVITVLAEEGAFSLVELDSIDEEGLKTRVWLPTADISR